LLNTFLQSLKSLFVFLAPHACSKVVAPATGAAENVVVVVAAGVVGDTGVVGVVVDATGVVDAVVGVVDAVVGVVVVAAGEPPPNFEMIAETVLGPAIPSVVNPKDFCIATTSSLEPSFKNDLLPCFKRIFLLSSSVMISLFMNIFFLFY
jgi:hypothetical protein